MTEIQLLQEIADLLKVQHPAKEIMGVKDAAEYLDIGVTLMRELISTYKIPHAPVKGKNHRARIVLRKKDLDAFVASRLISTPQDALRFQDGRMAE